MYISHKRAVKAHASLYIYAILPTHSLLTHTLRMNVDEESD